MASHSMTPQPPAHKSNVLTYAFFRPPFFHLPSLDANSPIQILVVSFQLEHFGPCWRVPGYLEIVRFGLLVFTNLTSFKHFRQELDSDTLKVEFIVVVPQQTLFPSCMERGTLEGVLEELVDDRNHSVELKPMNFGADLIAGLQNTRPDEMVTWKLVLELSAEQSLFETCA